MTITDDPKYTVQKTLKDKNYSKNGTVKYYMDPARTEADIAADNALTPSVQPANTYVQTIEDKVYGKDGAIAHTNTNAEALYYHMNAVIAGEEENKEENKEVVTNPDGPQGTPVK